MFPDLYLLIFHFVDSDSLVNLCCVNLEFYQLIRHHLKRYPKKFHMIQKQRKIESQFPMMRNYKDDNSWNQSILLSLNLIDQYGYILEIIDVNLHFIFLDRVLSITIPIHPYDHLDCVLDLKNHTIVCFGSCATYSSSTKYYVVCLKTLRMQKIPSIENFFQNHHISLQELSEILSKGTKLYLHYTYDDDFFRMSYLADDDRLMEYFIPCPLKSLGPYGTKRFQLDDHLIFFLDGRKAYFNRQVILNIIDGKTKDLKPHGLFDGVSWRLRCVTYGNKYFAGFYNNWYSLVEHKDVWVANKLIAIEDYPVLCDADGIFSIRKSQLVKKIE
jgi:hypothetical protein